MSEKPSISTPTPPARPRWNWRALLASCIVFLVIAVFGGPRSSATYEDPLTGRLKHEAIWMGWMLYSREEENDVSKWADRNSLAGVYPAQYGWSVVTKRSSRWFESPMIACGGCAIPARIKRGDFTVDGLTPEETLQKYQTELIAAYREHGSTIGFQKKWSARKN